MPALSRQVGERRPPQEKLHSPDSSTRSSWQRANHAPHPQTSILSGAAFFHQAAILLLTVSNRRGLNTTSQMHFTIRQP